MIRYNPLHWLLGSFQIFTFPSIFFLSQGKKSVQEKDNELMSAKPKVAIQERAQSNSISLPRGTLYQLSLPDNFCLIFSCLENEDKMKRLLFSGHSSQESLIFVCFSAEPRPPKWLKILCTAWSIIKITRGTLDKHDCPWECDIWIYSFQTQTV